MFENLLFRPAGRVTTREKLWLSWGCLLYLAALPYEYNLDLHTRYIYIQPCVLQEPGGRNRRTFGVVDLTHLPRAFHECSKKNSCILISDTLLSLGRGAVLGELTGENRYPYTEKLLLNVCTLRAAYLLCPWYVCIGAVRTCCAPGTCLYPAYCIPVVEPDTAVDLCFVPCPLHTWCVPGTLVFKRRNYGVCSAGIYDLFFTAG